MQNSKAFQKISKTLNPYFQFKAWVLALKGLNGLFMKYSMIKKTPWTQVFLKFLILSLKWVY